MPTVTQECGTDAVSKSATTPEAPFCPSGPAAKRVPVGAASGAERPLDHQESESVTCQRLELRSVVKEISAEVISMMLCCRPHC
jgi:hypothetical protein